MKMPDLASYMQTVIEQLEADKKRSAAHTYTYALKSIAEFYGGAGMPMPVDEVFTPGRLKEYEEWMRREGMRKRKREPKGLSLNTISTYMRNLKAVYHRMVGEKVLPYNPKLFDDVYTKVESQGVGTGTDEYVAVYRLKKIAFGSAVCAGLFFIDVPIPRNAVH